ncbi:MAG: mycothione reductase [Mycobacteriaceae bacterium]
MKHFDLVVIGSGSGNTILDSRFDDLDVAICEDGTFGGTCINVGCIPTKMYVYAAETARRVEQAHRYGVDAHVDKVRWSDIVDRVFGRIDPIAVNGKKYRSQGTPNTTLFTGRARFTGPGVLDTGTGESITYDKVVVAAGSRPVVPDVVARSGVPFHTNDDVMRLPTRPERLIILGGGYIAAEFAHVFSALGSQVTVLARSGHLLRHLDDDLRTRFTASAQQRWDVRLNTEVTAVRRREDGSAGGVEITLADGSTVVGDALLVATGRAPNTDELAVGSAGMGLEPDGRLMVDPEQRVLTSDGEVVEGAFALGDVSSPYQLKHVANHEARTVQHNLLHPDVLRSSDHRFVPAAVFTDPQIASVGLTEAEAREQGYDVTVKVQEYADVAYGWAMEDTEGFCKVIAEKVSGRLLGAHIMGAEASMIIQPLIQAMSFSLSAPDMAEKQYWIHPALPEVVENALLGLDV